MGTGELAPLGPIQQPPRTSVGLVGWLRKNLFSSWPSGLVTLGIGAALYAVGRSLLAWVFSEANWKVVSSNLEILTWGRYPRDQVWRLAVSLAAILVLALASWWARRGQRRNRRWILFAWLLSPLGLAVLLRGLIMPTPLTVFNHLGYYLFRPELLSLLGVEWRGQVAVLLVGLFGGLSWGPHPLGGEWSSDRPALRSWLCLRLTAYYRGKSRPASSFRISLRSYRFWVELGRLAGRRSEACPTRSQFRDCSCRPGCCCSRP